MAYALPPIAVTGEIITAAWGNDVRDSLAYLESGAFHVSATAPASPKTHDLWFDTTARKLKAYGTQKIVLTIKDGDDKIRFFDIEAGAYMTDREILLGSGVWYSLAATATRIYAVNSHNTDSLRVYDHQGVRKNSEEFSLSASTRTAGLVATSTRLIALDDNDNRIDFYDYSGASHGGEVISVGPGDWVGMCANDTHFWAVRANTNLAAAWTLSRARTSSEDISLGSGTWEGAAADHDRLYFLNDTGTDNIRVYDHDGDRRASEEFTLSGGDFGGIAMLPGEAWYSL